MLEEKKILLQFLSTENIIYYTIGTRGSSVKLEQEDYEILYQKLGQKWHNENDKLILFEYYLDGSFNIERQKTVFDYRIREQTKKYYTFVEVTREEVIATYNTFVDFFEEVRVKDLQRAKDQVRNQLREARTIFKQNVVVMRNDLLVKSDWTQMLDVTFKHQGEKELWHKYRQYLRDMSDLEDWSDNIMRVEFPITPKEYYQIDPQETVEYLTDSSHFENKSIVHAKMKLIRFMEQLGLPSLIADAETNDLDYEKAKKSLEKALSKIDEAFELPSLTVLPFSNEITLDSIIDSVENNTLE
jgi:hypothetical protein